MCKVASKTESEMENIKKDKIKEDSVDYLLDVL